MTKRYDSSLGNPASMFTVAYVARENAFVFTLDPLTGLLDARCVRLRVCVIGTNIYLKQRFR